MCEDLSADVRRSPNGGAGELVDPHGRRPIRYRKATATPGGQYGDHAPLRSGDSERLKLKASDNQVQKPTY